MAQPRFLDDPAFRALRLSDFEAFNRHVAGLKVVDFSNADLRGVDFRGVADIGQNHRPRLVHARHRSARPRHPQLGTWKAARCTTPRSAAPIFPTNLSPHEISNSIQLGTRMRTE